MIPLRTHKYVWTEWVRSRFGHCYGALGLPIVLKVWVRDALQEILDCWNSIFDGAKEMLVDFCPYISPFQSTTSTARPCRACP
jgi:hypothetical protein